MNCSDCGYPLNRDGRCGLCLSRRELYVEAAVGLATIGLATIGGAAIVVALVGLLVRRRF